MIVIYGQSLEVTMVNFAVPPPIVAAAARGPDEVAPVVNHRWCRRPSLSDLGRIGPTGSSRVDSPFGAIPLAAVPLLDVVDAGRTPSGLRQEPVGKVHLEGLLVAPLQVAADGLEVRYLTPASL